MYMFESVIDFAIILKYDLIEMKNQLKFIRTLNKHIFEYVCEMKPIYDWAKLFFSF